MTSSVLSTTDRIVAYQMFLLPKLRSPLPCTLLSKQQLRKIHRPALKVVNNPLNLNSTFPLTIIHGNKRYFGLELKSLYVQKKPNSNKLLHRTHQNK